MQRQTREATIGVSGESYRSVHAFIQDAPPDLPDEYTEALQTWAHDHFATTLDPGETHTGIGTMEYYPNDKVVAFHLR